MRCPQCGAAVQATDTICPACMADVSLENERAGTSTPLPPGPTVQEVRLTPALAALPRHVKRQRVIYTLLALLLVAALIPITASYLNAAGASKLTRNTLTPGMTASVSATTATGTDPGSTPGPQATTGSDTTPTAGSGGGGTTGSTPTAGSGGGTTGSTPTATTDFAATGATVAANPSNFNGSCGAFIDITFTETLTANMSPIHAADALTFHWVHSDGTRGPDDIAPFHDGNTTQVWQSDWSLPIRQAGSSLWIELVVTAPNALTSNRTNFTFHCTNQKIGQDQVSLTASPASYNCNQTSITVTFTGQVMPLDNPADDPAGVTYSYIWQGPVTSSAPTTVTIPPGILTSTVNTAFTVQKSAGNTTYAESFKVSVASVVVAVWTINFTVNCP